MPDESKKNQQKSRNDPKDKRKPRQRHSASLLDKKTEACEENKKKKDDCKVPQKPIYEEPGPEFYKNLKRETDEILKITEEENSKYKKKEIQSNWTKYEMPIESYEEIEEQENMGADYEKLIEAPSSIGGHFQFKHERSWDVDVGPSLYDKYFEMNMDSLFNSISTLPFYDRCNIDKTLLSDTDILSINNRATRYKRTYYNDKSFKTTELENVDVILNKLGSSESETNLKSVEEKEDNADDVDTIGKNSELDNTELKLDVNDTNSKILLPDIDLKLVEGSLPTVATPKPNQSRIEPIEAFDNIDLSEPSDVKPFPQENDMNSEKLLKLVDKNLVSTNKSQEKPVPQEKPVIESPEDLEKWLDDFLDG